MKQTYKLYLLGVGLALLMTLGWAVALTGPARAQTAAHNIDRAEILAAYDAFKSAQNERDLPKVGTYFIDGPEFLWVSDGQSYWGREAVLTRMSLFQGAGVWRVEPDLTSARVVELGPDVAMLNMRLVLVIGSAAKPSTLPFLVSILFRRTGEPADWKIAALLTTGDTTTG